MVKSIGIWYTILLPEFKTNMNKKNSSAEELSLSYCDLAQKTDMVHTKYIILGHTIQTDVCTSFGLCNVFAHF